MTPPRVKRHTLTCVLAGEDDDNIQDQDGGEEEDSAYFPSGQCTSPIEKIMRIPPLPLLCVNPKVEEQKDKMLQTTGILRKRSITTTKHIHQVKIKISFHITNSNLFPQLNHIFN